LDNCPSSQDLKINSICCFSLWAIKSLQIDTEIYTDMAQSFEHKKTVIYRILFWATLVITIAIFLMAHTLFNDSTQSLIVGFIAMSVFLAVAITSELHMLRSVRKSRQEMKRLSLLTDAVPCTISWINRDMTYIEANQQLADLVGLDKEAFKGMHVGGLGGDPKYIAFVESIFDFPEQEISFEFRETTGDAPRDILSLARKYNNDTEAVIVGVDITKQKESEQIIRKQNEALTSSAKMSALGEVASGIGHEINNPVSVINVYAEQLIKLANSEKMTPERMVDIGTKINKSVQRIARIVKSLRMFARNSKDDPFEKIAVSEIISDTLELVHDRVMRKNVELFTAKIPDNVYVECHEVEVSQVLINLINNATDAIEKFEEKWIELEFEDLGDSVQLAVKDSGKRISEELYQKIMQPFYTTKSVGKGTGLGLSISTRIVNQHHGEITLDRSCENTRFVVTLPKNQPEDDSKAA
jgi:C4-dicarboxylate-specific signal transduction histidine kinase